MQSAVASYPLPDLVHVLGQDVVHVLQVGSQELPLRFTSVLLFFTKDQTETDMMRKTLFLITTLQRRDMMSY